MVLDESSVLPAVVALDPLEGTASLDDDLETLSQSRPSRPSLDVGWIDDNHYFDHDVPDDSFDSSELPKTEHDFNSFTLDVPLADSDAGLMQFTVTGLF